MKVLILFAHPALHKSNIHRKLIEGLDSIGDLTFHDLYESYPEHDIDIKKEQKLMSMHDCIIFQHPMYWYSMPALLKEWIDLVLTHGWAYGSMGNALKGKLFFNVISTGGPKQAYMPTGMHKHTVRELILPIDLTVRRCGMLKMPPYVVHGTYAMDNSELAVHKFQFNNLLHTIINNKFNITLAQDLEYLNDYKIEEGI